MFLPFYDALRDSGVPVSVREYLGFLEGLNAGLATYDVNEFYYLARCAMVKDERFLDRFDRAFASAFKGVEAISLDEVLEAVDLEWGGQLADDGALRFEDGDPAVGWFGVPSFGGNAGRNAGVSRSTRSPGAS